MSIDVKPSTSDAIALIGRILIASLFIWSGISKLGHPAAVVAMIGRALPFPVVGLAISLFCELIAAPLLLLGWRSRIWATILAIFTLATAMAFHNNFGDREAMINFTKNIAIAGGLLQVVAFGGGAMAVRAKSRSL
jgi:putative oxidoreductase